MEKIEVEILKGDPYLDFASFVAVMCEKFRITDQKGFVNDLLTMIGEIKNAAVDVDEYREKLFSIISKYSTFNDMKDITKGAIKEVKEINRILKDGDKHRSNE